MIEENQLSLLKSFIVNVSWEESKISLFLISCDILGKIKAGGDRIIFFIITVDFCDT